MATLYCYHRPVAVTLPDNCLYVMKGQRFACYLNSVTNDLTSSISWLGLSQPNSGWLCWDSEDETDELSWSGMGDDIC